VQASWRVFVPCATILSQRKIEKCDLDTEGFLHTQMVCYHTPTFVTLYTMPLTSVIMRADKSSISRFSTACACPQSSRGPAIPSEPLLEREKLAGIRRE
jgi:hypothetical protein